MRLLATLAVAAVVLAGGADAATTPSSPGTVTVTGTGIATTVPDEASFSFTVDTKGTTATAALSRNSADARAVIAAIEAAGVAESNIQTEQVSLDPVQSQDGTKIVGFDASNTVDVENLAVASAGAVVDAAVGAGATGISGPSLTASAQDAVYAQALKAAVVQAHAKAQALADAAGQILGAAVSVVEGGGTPPPVPFAQGAAATPSVPVEPGTQQVQATVTVSYALG